MKTIVADVPFPVTLAVDQVAHSEVWNTSTVTNAVARQNCTNMTEKNSVKSACLRQFPLLREAINLIKGDKDYA